MSGRVLEGDSHALGGMNLSGRGTEQLQELARLVKTPGSSDLTDTKNIRAIFFSGGVADLIYHVGTDAGRYGDIGVLLGASIRKSRLCSAFEMVSPGETIRATVVGAGTYTTTISGSTISYSQELLPLKNLPVIKLDATLQAECFEGRAENIIRYIQWTLSQNDAKRFVLAMQGVRNPDYVQMKQAAAAIRQAIDAVLPPKEPLLLVIESDIAKAMGQLLRRLPGMGRQVVAIDSIHVEDGEYIDMGKPLMDGMVIPVVVKTLIFG